ncbi:MAG: hypothetical protein HUU03_03060 [Planctomycetaceae bacterium]|nr:hypothetical protein [Planctomycetota bacterium]MCQ3948813.1 hypothetical protein [Planctomycetota bacterium]NUO15403.1 hypothetical protein [Planctomycetaceae bacterium]GIK51532.1 MAG: hypothetical protein BroJett014_05050 [Planctomycetota bacterium]HRJ77782.1 hypothetical protein [Planctomycetota bacterium]
MNARDKMGIKTRARAAFQAQWHEHAEPVKLVCQVIRMQIKHGTGDLHTELSKAFVRLGLDVIDAIVDEL